MRMRDQRGMCGIGIASIQQSFQAAGRSRDDERFDLAGHTHMSLTCERIRPRLCVRAQFMGEVMYQGTTFSRAVPRNHAPALAAGKCRSLAAVGMTIRLLGTG